MTCVYFVQPKDGGPIRVGATQDTASRAVSIGCWHPSGVEILGTIPGYFAREAMIHFLLRRHGLRRDWFRSCSTVWRLLLDAEETRLSWLPPEPTPEEWRGFKDEFERRASRVFPSRLALANAAGVGVDTVNTAFRATNWKPSVVLWAPIVLREVDLQGRLPGYLQHPNLFDVTAPPSDRRAAA